MSRAASNAFPIPGLQDDATFNGITIREHFAAMAMQGLMSVPRGSAPEGLSGEQWRAYWAVKHADALLAELAKVQP